MSVLSGAASSSALRCFFLSDALNGVRFTEPGMFAFVWVMILNQFIYPAGPQKNWMCLLLYIDAVGHMILVSYT